MWHLALWLSLKLVTPQAKMESFIVGGFDADIEDFPHAAYLKIDCLIGEDLIAWGCGSSILNQRILLTTAHCLSCGNHTSTRVVVRPGNEDRRYGAIRTSNGFIIHAMYDDHTHSHDIGLVKVSRPLKFGETVGRVAILKNPPYSEDAEVAGWGETDAMRGLYNTKLMKLNQKVLKNVYCRQKIENMPPGTICAHNNNLERYASP